MRVLSASIGSLPERTQGSSERHQPLCTTTSSPTLTFFTSRPRAQTIPEQSLPPAWKSSGSPVRFRSAITSSGVPSAAQTLL